MKPLQFLLVLMVFAWLHAEAAERIVSTKVGDEYISGISSVKAGKDGKIIILYSGGGMSTTKDKVSESFLESWGITQEKIESAVAAGEKDAQALFDRAVAAGLFREVDGIVYDLRKVQAGWTRFPKVKLVQALEEGALVDPAPDKPSMEVIFVRNLPIGISDTDRFPLIAKLIGSFSYINQLESSRTVRAYDVGRPCAKSDIPEEISRDGKLWAAAKSSTDAKKVLSKLPGDADRDLRTSGTGFFITEDGYLLTNAHVIEEAARVKIKTAKAVYDAKVVRVDRKRDLALLKVEGRGFEPLALAREPAALGSAVFTIGFPNFIIQGLEPKYTDGKISSLSGVQDDPQHYQISVPVQPGNSGGPLLDSNGRVVGIVVARLSDLAMFRASGNLPQNVNYAIKSAVASEFLTLSPEAKLSSSSEKSKDPVAVASKAVAMVLGYE